MYCDILSHSRGYQGSPYEVSREYEGVKVTLWAQKLHKDTKAKISHIS